MNARLLRAMTSLALWLVLGTPLLMVTGWLLGFVAAKPVTIIATLCTMGFHVMSYLYFRNRIQGRTAYFGSVHVNPDTSPSITISTDIIAAFVAVTFLGATVLVGFFP